MARPKKYEDVTIGKVYGKLTIIGTGNNSRYCKDRTWLCKCECGNEVEIQEMKLKTGWTKSCGCFRSMTTTLRKTRHGFSHTRLHDIWCGIKSRCTNANTKSYKHYGGRGIKICDEWLKFENFRDWSYKHGYADNLSIDRIDVNGDYSPLNCRWVDIVTQMNNTTRTVLLTYNGETHSLAEWARILNVNYHALKRRRDAGWDINDIFERPYKTGSKSLAMQHGGLP